MNTIGALLITSCTLYAPESGGWVLEIDHDLPTGAPAPTGKVACLIGGTTFVGTVDPATSGVFGTRARCRVVGAAEWSRSLPKRDFQNPAGVTSAVVVAATAAELGIVATVTAPEILGTHFTRTTGEASQVLGRSGWWVSPDGVTTVGPRVPGAPGTDFFLGEYDPLSRMAQASSQAPVLPGTVIPDPRLPGGALRVRETTQTWNADGASASLWIGEVAATAAQGPRLAGAIQALARAAVRPELLTAHVFTVVGQAADGGYLLQSEVQGPVPDATPVVHWPGVPGLSCKVTPSSRVLVTFRGNEPVVIGFDDTTPIEMSFGGPVATGIATLETMQPLFFAIGLFFTAAQAFFNFPLISALSGGTAQAAATQAGLVVAQLAQYATFFSTRIKASR